MATKTTAAERTELARLAAYTLHSQVADPVARLEPARRGFRAKFEHEVDPDGVLDPDERERRADYAMKAHMARLRVKAIRAKAAKQATAAAA